MRKDFDVPPTSRARHIALLASTLALAGVLLQPGVSAAQITLDGTLRAGAPSGPLTGPNFVIPASVGEVRGNNLFHSFGQFNVNTGQTAIFTATGLVSLPTSIANILSRVTGGQRSFIDGLIDSRAMPNANFFLLNPSGVMFGPNASLNIGGAFHVSTANYLRFADSPDGTPGGKFSANTSLLPTSGLTTDPVAFGFLNSAPVRIAIDGGIGACAAPPCSLQVDAGKIMSVVSGDAPVVPMPGVPIPGETETGLKIAGAGPSSTTTTLLAPGGRVQIVSVASAGEVIFSPNLDVSSVPNLGRVDLSNGARVDVSGNPGGSVVIRGGNIVIGGASGIRVQTSGSGAAGDVGITASRLEMKESAFIESTTSGGGAGGDILVTVGTLVLTTGANISSISNPPFNGTGGGPGGQVRVTATDSVSIDCANSGFNSNTSSNLPDGSGTGGKLSLSTPSLTLDHGGSITTSSSGRGAGGDVAVQVGSLSLSNGATLVSHTISAQGGNLTVTATDSAVISGKGSGIFSGGVSDSSAVAPVGNISMNVGKLILTGAAEIRNGSIIGQTGALRITAEDSLVVSGGSGISSQAFDQPVGQISIRAPSVLIDNGFIATSTIGSGNAGPVFLDVGILTLANGGQIVSSSAGSATGAGGTVTVAATDSISISGSAPSVSALFAKNPIFPKDPRSGLFSTASGDGPAGKVNVFSPSLTLADAGKISVATGQLKDGVPTGNGRGGDINIATGQIQLLDGATISANSAGTASALAGNVTIVTNGLRMKDSSITTASELADGGNISITTTGSLLYLLDSKITTSVGSGLGSGGNITLGSLAHPVEFIVLNDSQIRADAFGGPGGNINILADTYLTSNSVVSASSALSAPGTIDVQARVTNVSGSLAQLPESVLQAAALLRAACAARLSAGKTSSLVVAGREGLPLEPGGVMPSPLVAEGSADTRLSRSDGQEWESLRETWRVSLRSKCSM